MAFSPTNFNKYKNLDVASVTGTPTISKAVPLKIIGGDDSSTGTGEIVLDWTNIADKQDIAVSDENDNLLDYYFESFDATSETAVIWVYRDWVRDGSTQLKVYYGSNSDNTDHSVSAPTVFSKESNLQAGYLFNEESGDLLDVSGNNNDGTLSGDITQGVLGIVNGAYDFGGTDGHIDTDSFTSSSPFTYVTTFKTDLSGTQQRLLHSSSDPTEVIELLDDGTFKGQIWDGSNGHGEVIGGSYTSDTWYRLVYIYDPDNNNAELWVNGNQIGTASPSYTFSNTDTKILGVHSSDVVHLDGIMDDSYYYGKAFNSDMVSADHDSTKSSPDFFSQQAAETINQAPDAPTNPSPADGETISETTSTTLSVDVSDPDGDSMDVTFYDASDDSSISTDTGVASGGTASVTWSGLSAGSSYSWYAIADDGSATTQSSTWSFTINQSPNSPTNPDPSDNSTVKDGTRQDLSVDVSDPDGDSLNVIFYDASNDNTINSLSGISSGSTATITWTNLTPGSSYSWYVVVDDGTDTTTSSTWSFTINDEPSASNPSPSDGSTYVSINTDLSVDINDPDGDSVDVTFYWGKSNEVYFEGFEDGTLGTFTANDSNFQTYTSPVYKGSYSAGIEADSTSDPVATATPFSGGANPDSFSFYWYETSSSHGGGIALVDSGGTIILGLTTDNHEWNVYDNAGWTEIASNSISDYGNWIYFSVTFDWVNGEYTYYFEDTVTGQSRSGTRTLVSNTDIEQIHIKNQNAESWDSSSQMYMWFDDIKFKNNASSETVTGVSSGTTATTSSLSLDYGTTYYWFTELNDGVDTIDSTAWSFTTEPATYTETIISDAYILESTPKTINSDAYILKTYSDSINSSSHILKQKTTTIQSDAQIVQPRETISSDYYIAEQKQETITSDYYITKSKRKRLDSNYYIEKIKQTIISSSSHILKQKTETISSDYYLLSEEKYDLSSSSFIKKTYQETILSSSYVRKTITTDIISNSYISEKITDSILTNSYIKTVKTAEQLSDSLIKSTKQLKINSDIFIEEVQQNTITQDSFINLAFQETITSDAEILEQVYRYYIDSDYYIRKLYEPVISSDAFITIPVKETITSSADINIPIKETISSDAYISIASRYSLKSDSNIFKENTYTIQSSSKIVRIKPPVLISPPDESSKSFVPAEFVWKIPVHAALEDRPVGSTIQFSRTEDMTSQFAKEPHTTTNPDFTFEYRESENDDWKPYPTDGIPSSVYNTDTCQARVLINNFGGIIYWRVRLCIREGGS